MIPLRSRQAVEFFKLQCHLPRLQARRTSTFPPNKSKNGIVVNSGKKGAQKHVLGPTLPWVRLPNRPELSTAKLRSELRLPVIDWSNGELQQTGAVLQVVTRPAVLYTHLFAALGEFVRGVVYILLGVGGFFALIELIALIIGTRMTRTVTAAVAQLHVATRHVDRGDFSHRIPVKSNDQLADLAVRSTR